MARSNRQLRLVGGPARSRPPALKKDPRSFDGLRFSGNIPLLEKDPRTAILRFQEANQVKPWQPELVRTLVETLFSEHQDTRAGELARA